MTLSQVPGLAARAIDPQHNRIVKPNGANGDDLGDDTTVNESPGHLDVLW
jgi:hypothetical protein